MDLSDSDSGDPLSSSRPQHTSSSDKQLETNFAIVCRVKRSVWWLVWLGLFEAAFMFVAPFLPDKQHPASNVRSLVFIAWPVGLFLAGAVLWMAVELCRGEILADAEELAWKRGLGGWRKARWEEINDFYQKHPNGSPIVETPVGILELSRSFEGIESIKELVAERAVNAPARLWEIQGHRGSEAWSKTLSPWANAQKWAAPVLTVGALVLATVFGAMIVGAFGSHNSTSEGLWIDIVPGLFALLFFGSLIGGMIWMTILEWRERQFLWSHRDEEVRLNARGITFSSLNERIEAGWEEITGVTALPRNARLWPIRIETTQGNFVVWQGANTSMWRQMAPLLRQYAPAVLEPLQEQTRQETQRNNDLEGERGAWRGGEIGLGAQRWSYRSRETRSLLGFVSFLAVLMPFLYLQRHYTLLLKEGSFHPSWTLFGNLCLLSVLAVGTAWTWYMRAEILADENGLELHSPFHLAYRASWGSIEGLGQDAFGEFVRAGGRRLYISRLFAPVRREQLREYIENKVGGGQ